MYTQQAAVYDINIVKDKIRLALCVSAGILLAYYLLLAGIWLLWNKPACMHASQAEVCLFTADFLPKNMLYYATLSAALRLNMLAGFAKQAIFCAKRGARSKKYAT
nr:hypothetical protein [Ophiocordyceps sp.]